MCALGQLLESVKKSLSTLASGLRPLENAASKNIMPHTIRESKLGSNVKNIVLLFSVDVKPCCSIR